MKRTCKGCKALLKNPFDFGYDCGLKHTIEVTKEIDGIPICYRPLKDCEKPKTITEYIKLKSNLTEANTIWKNTKGIN